MLESLIIVFITVIAINIIISMIFKKNTEPVEGKPTKEEFQKSMNLLLKHGIINNQQYTEYTNKGRAFANKDK